MLKKSDAKHWIQQAGLAVDGLRLGFATGTIWPGLIVAICVGIGIRFVVRLNQGFWEDEIIAVTHAVQPLQWLFIEVARNDTHPPTLLPATSLLEFGQSYRSLVRCKLGDMGAGSTVIALDRPKTR